MFIFLAAKTNHKQSNKIWPTPEDAVFFFFWKVRVASRSAGHRGPLFLPYSRFPYNHSVVATYGLKVGYIGRPMFLFKTPEKVTSNVFVMETHARFPVKFSAFDVLQLTTYYFTSARWI